MTASVALLAGLAWWAWDRTQGSSVGDWPGAMDRAKLAVLPFDSFTDDPELDQLAVGIPTEVASLFVGGWPVVPLNTSFPFKGSNVCDAAREMQVRYVLEGSVARVGERRRVTAQLIDCPRGDHLWAKDFDGEAGDTLAFQDEVGLKVVSQTLQVLWTSITTDDPQNPLFPMSQGTKEGTEKTLKLLREAVERSPADEDYRNWMVIALNTALLHQWTESPVETTAEMERFAQECLALNPTKWPCHQAAGQAYRVTGQPERMIEAFEQMVARSGGLPVAHWMLGDALAIVGRTDEAIASIEEAMRLSPDDRQLDLWLISLARAHFAAGRYTDARGAIKRSIALNPRLWWAHELLAVIEGHLGSLEEAETALAEAHRLGPSRTLRVVRDSPFLSTVPPDQLARYLDGLRMAGMAE